MSPDELRQQEEFEALMKSEKPIIHEFNGKFIYFFKNSVWRDKEPTTPNLNDRKE